MPIMDEETRKRIEEKIKRRTAIETEFTPKFTAVQCHLCGWFSNGRSIDEAYEANFLHEWGHSEYQAWYDSCFTLEELWAIRHDYECHPAPCACKCGCKIELGCVEGMDILCGPCQVAAMRGHAEHGKKIRALLGADNPARLSQSAGEK